MFSTARCACRAASNRGRRAAFPTPSSRHTKARSPERASAAARRCSSESHREAMTLIRATTRTIRLAIFAMSRGSDSCDIVNAVSRRRATASFLIQNTTPPRWIRHTASDIPADCAGTPRRCHARPVSSGSPTSRRIEEQVSRIAGAKKLQRSGPRSAARSVHAEIAARHWTTHWTTHWTAWSAGNSWLLVGALRERNRADHGAAGVSPIQRRL